MIYRTQVPIPALKDYVRCFWMLESNRPYTHYAMADSCAELLFHYNGVFSEVHADGSTSKSFRSGISAPNSQIRTFEINSGFGLFGIYLYPYTIVALSGVPLADLANRMPTLDELLGNLGRELEEKVLTCVSWQQRIHTVEQFLLARLAGNQLKCQPVVHAIQRILNNSSSLSVKELAATYFISERQLERQFLHYTGFTPKYFMRIARFQQAVEYYGSAPLKLTEIAHQCGYYDQAHFIHDFKQFSGVRPRDFFAGKSLAMGWLE